MEDRPDISVIIVSWNVRHLLIKCLDALLSPGVAEGLRLEVLVIDNASIDGTAEALRERPGVKLVEAGSNLGYGRANNVGFALARGRHFLVLNPDTVPQPGSLRSLLCFMDAHPTAGIVSPRLVNADGSVQASAFRFPTLLMALLDLFEIPPLVPGRIRQRILSSSLNGRYPQEAAATAPFRIDHPLGACMLLNSEAYRQVGGFDPAIHMYSEEIDLARRYAAAGWERWQVPAARVVHLGGQSTAQAPDRMFVELWRSRLYIYSKYRPLPARMALAAILATSQLWDALKTLAALRTGAISREAAHRRWRRAGATIRLIFHE